VIYQLISAVVQEAHGLTQGQSTGVMIGVLVLLATVLLAPFGSGGVISRPAHQHSGCAEGPCQERRGRRCACSERMGSTQELPSFFQRSATCQPCAMPDSH
jgi:hypothetical protein